MPIQSSPSLSRARPVRSDTFSVLLESLRALNARSVIDIGCGHGEICGKLHNLGFAVTGIDPQPDVIAAARRRAPGVTFLTGSAEDLPPLPGPFSAACFINALHHVAQEQMENALMAAIRLVGPEGRVLVIEPLATGSFFRAMRPVEDESVVRAQAVATVDRLIAEGKLRLAEVQHWDRLSNFPSLDAFVDYLVRVDPDRAEAARTNMPALARAWRDNIAVVGGHAQLCQPLVCWSLAMRA